MIRIIDCGSQLTQNIARRVRELGVFTEVVPFHVSYDKIVAEGLEGIIISGGQFSVYDKGSPDYVNGVLFGSVPVLGICYGQQSIAHKLGGEVKQTQQREYGRTQVVLLRESRLFQGIQEKDFTVWMSHGDIVEKMPHGFEMTARSQNGHIAAMERNHLYAVQFHPEVDHTEYGRQILDNFLNICQAKRTWDPDKVYGSVVEETRAKVRGKVGIGGISGGVDSTTVSLLVHRIAGENYHPIFVNNGLLRLHEEEEVMSSLAPFGFALRYVDASDRFLSALDRESDPDVKRTIIGNLFGEVFKDVAKEIVASYFVQGTLYPDVIESVPVYGASARIKRHHNVEGGGLPDIGLEVIEPFRLLFKDEVRKIAEEKLQLPREIIWRHPFPGPGLAVRILGEITRDKIDIARRADAVFIDELKKRGLYDRISQAFVVLANRSTAVMGDASSYEYVVALRAVVTKDFMTSDRYRFTDEERDAIFHRITSEVKGVNRVVEDISTKPPSTIEWE